jgi:hypothetical protein
MYISIYTHTYKHTHTHTHTHTIAVQNHFAHAPLSSCSAPSRTSRLVSSPRQYRFRRHIRGTDRRADAAHQTHSGHVRVSLKHTGGSLSMQYGTMALEQK